MGMVFQQFNLFGHIRRAGQRDAGARAAFAKHHAHRANGETMQLLFSVGACRNLQVPVATVGRTAAAGGHCPCAGHGSKVMLFDRPFGAGPEMVKGWT